MVDARRHVNKMCMAANVPLVESGTAGYLGQVQPILKVRHDLFLCSFWIHRQPAYTLRPTGQSRVLRLRPKTNTKIIPCLHHPFYPVTTYTLHCMGEELPDTVSD